ncbi:MAG: hypothetical protein J6W82_02690 [Bacteroidales bacterium]|nr:hypothetical protein [Bacteroidales bacterium]
MKKIFRLAIVFALAGAALLTGCTKDYGTEIADLQKAVTDLQSTVKSLQDVVKGGAVITDVVSTAEGVTIKTTNGEYKITNGKDGKDGKDGADGKNGTNGTNGTNGKDGKDGTVLTIGTDGYWYLDGKKTDYKAAGKDGADGKDGKDGENGKDGKDGENGKDGISWTIQEVNGVLSFVSSTGEVKPVFADGSKPVTAVWNKDSNSLDIYNVDGIEGGKVSISTLPELTSIVFVPEIYFEGIEALEYIYVKDNYYKVDTTPVPDTVEKAVPGLAVGGATIKFPADMKRIPAIEGSNGKKVQNILAWTKNNGAYSFSRLCYADYNINPSTFPIEQATWFWDWYDKENRTRKTNAWQPSAPKVESFTKDGEKGILKVSFTINNADKLTPVAPSKNVSIIELRGSYKRGDETKVVASDYEALVPYKEAFHAIAFKLSTTYRTAAEDCPLVTVNQTPHLYPTAKLAAEEARSVPVTYNAGPFSLDIVNIHMKKPGDQLHQVGVDEKEYTIAELQKYYPNLKLHFEPVSYTLGGNVTEEDKFCDIYEDADGKWWFQPMYVNKHKADGSWDTSAACPKGEETGISSVGRRPIVLVTLIDTANSNKVVLRGYFKVEIVKKAVDPIIATVHVFDFDPFGMLCNPQADPADPADFYNNYDAYDYRKETKWALFSNLVLEQTLKMDYDQFKGTFNWENGKTYELKNKNMVATDDYGRIIYVQDTGAGGINDKFVILFRKENYDKFVADKITEKELYAHFTSLGEGEVWLGFKVSIVDKPKVTFAEKNPKYWFDDLKEKNYEQNIRVSVKVPNKTEDDVTKYVKFFDDNWVGNKVQLALGTDAVSQWYKDIWATLPIEYEYRFSKTQDNYVYPDPADPTKTKTAKFYVSDDQKTIYIDAAHLHPIATITNENYVTNNDVNVFDPTVNADKLTYLCNDDSKELLNGYEYKTEANSNVTLNKVSEMLYFKIDLTATYGVCKIPCAAYTFPARMIRPLTIKNGEAGKLLDAVITGDNVEIGKIFSAYDWQGNPVLTYKNNAYVEGVVNGVNLYKYFGLATLELDIDNVLTDQTGEYKYLFDGTRGGKFIEGVNNAAKLWVANKANPQVAVSPAIVDISTAANLANYLLHYENNAGVVNDFNFKIPFKMTYKWGEINGTVVVPVEHTQSL